MKSMISETARRKITHHLASLYDEDLSVALAAQIENLVDQYRQLIPEKNTESCFTERDAILITYGDMVREAGIPPLDTLNDFLSVYAKGIFSGVHILPFFPFSSDDGFSVIDFKHVNPALGKWNHLEPISHHFKLMVDLVVNHVSAKSRWFQGFLEGDPQFEEFFITVEDGEDLRKVVRPRALPLLTEVETSAGQRKVWTTFSEDQVDLNYKNPKVLLAVLDVLLFYVQMGADMIRLDAVAYVWKEIGTPCIHLPQAHDIVQLMRTLLDEVAPWVILVTETNVPHEENISYFGDGTNEAQMVYNFSLPPLVLHSFISGNAIKISDWADHLKLPSGQVTFFNFLASHDGIGITPARGILSDPEINEIVEYVKSIGGLISYKTNPEGFSSPYELNINFFDALAGKDLKNEAAETQTRRFLTSHAIMCSLRGVPGCYFHSLVGSRGWQEGVHALGYARAINREKLDYKLLKRDLSDANHQRSRIYHELQKLITVRRQNRAFNPTSKQQILFLDPRVFTLVRTDHEDTQRILCLHNVSDEEVSLTVDLQNLGLKNGRQVKNLLTQKEETPSACYLKIDLEAYNTAWFEII